MVGYAAPHTLAYQLLNDKSSVEINQQKNKIKADIHSTDVFSAHADQSELLQFIQKVDGPRLKKIFLTHGNNEAKIHLMKKIKTQSSAEVHLPQYGETIEL
jgi:metallo-beta-lactamase family protein